MIDPKDDILNEFDDEFGDALDTDGLDIGDINDKDIINVEDSNDDDKQDEELKKAEDVLKETAYKRGKDKKPRKRRWHKKPKKVDNAISNVVQGSADHVTIKAQSVVDGVNSITKAYDEIKALANSLIDKLDIFSKKVVDIKEAVKKIIE